MTTILRSSRLLISKIFCPSPSRFSVLYIRTMHAPRPSLIRFIAASQSENRFTGSWTQYDNSHELNGAFYICNAALREINGYQRCWTLVCCLFMRIHRRNFVNEFPDSNSAWKLVPVYMSIIHIERRPSKGTKTLQNNVIFYIKRNKRCFLPPRFVQTINFSTSIDKKNVISSQLFTDK